MKERFGDTPEPREESESGDKEQNVILERIINDTGIPNIFDKLNEIPNTDFQSLLLEVSEKKSLKTGIQEISSALESNPFVKESEVDQRTFIKFDNLAYELLPPTYRGIELSPLVPFATNRVLAGISQKRVLSTTRNSEVISDPTTALALYSAKERSEKLKRNPKDLEVVKLAASQRVIRQDQITQEGYAQHFRTFTVAAAGRDVGFEKFERENFNEHLNYFLSIFRGLNESGDFDIKDITVTLSNVSVNQPELLDIINTSVITELKATYPGVTFKVDLSRRSNYYESLCYKISATNKDHVDPVSIAGGGITNWTKILVGSKKERLLVGSIGSEVLCKKFKK